MYNVLIFGLWLCIKFWVFRLSLFLTRAVCSLSVWGSNCTTPKDAYSGQRHHLLMSLGNDCHTVDRWQSKMWSKCIDEQALLTKKNEGHHLPRFLRGDMHKKPETWRSVFKSSVDKHIPRQYLRTRSSPSLFADWIYICNHFRASPGHTVVLIMLEESYSNMNFWQNSSAASCSVIVGSILLQFLVLVLRHQFSMKLSPICEKSLHDAQALA